MCPATVKLGTDAPGSAHAATTSDFSCLLCVRRRRGLASSMVSTNVVGGHHPRRYRPTLPDGMPGRIQCEFAAAPVSCTSRQETRFPTAAFCRHGEPRLSARSGHRRTRFKPVVASPLLRVYRREERPCGHIGRAIPWDSSSTSHGMPGKIPPRPHSAAPKRFPTMVVLCSPEAASQARSAFD